MSYEYCSGCGVALTAEEQLYFLDVCHLCECTMWLGDGWKEWFDDVDSRTTDQD